MPCEAGAVQHRCVSQMAAAAAAGSRFCAARSRRYQESTPHDDVRRLRTRNLRRGSARPSPRTKKGRLDRSAKQSSARPRRMEHDHTRVADPDVSEPCPACPNAAVDGARDARAFDGASMSKRAVNERFAARRTP